MVMLRRLGSKEGIFSKILPYFPAHTVYVEPFFGAGGMFFNKPISRYNLMNDKDSEIFNLYFVIKTHYKEFLSAVKALPIHSDLISYWKINKEQKPVDKALRFLFLSNFVVPFTGGIPIKVFDNTKDICIENLISTYKTLISRNIRFFNEDFRSFLKIIQFLDVRPNQLKSTFIYADPPYLDTTGGNYTGFTEQDSLNLFDSLQSKKCKWAMSEFDNPFILNQAKERGLNVIIIGERRNINNRRTEILVTNYKTPNKSLI